jgi:hypothetical protein
VEACAHFGPLWTGKRVEILCDNTATVHAIGAERSGCEEMMEQLRELDALKAIFQFDLIVTHIPGHLNGLADALSRGDTARYARLLEAWHETHSIPCAG